MKFNLIVFSTVFQLKNGEYLKEESRPNFDEDNFRFKKSLEDKSENRSSEAFNSLKENPSINLTEILWVQLNEKTTENFPFLKFRPKMILNFGMLRFSNEVYGGKNEILFKCKCQKSMQSWWEGKQNKMFYEMHWQGLWWQVILNQVGCLTN